MTYNENVEAANTSLHKGAKGGGGGWGWGEKGREHLQQRPTLLDICPQMLAVKKTTNQRLAEKSVHFCMTAITQNM